MQYQFFLMNRVFHAMKFGNNRVFYSITERLVNSVELIIRFVICRNQNKAVEIPYTFEVY